VWHLAWPIFFFWIYGADESHECGIVLPPGHHGARILNLSETDILKSKKNRKKIMHVDNHDFYLHAKNQSKILCILAGIKKTNIQI
jgi:hypothetical protein